MAPSRFVSRPWIQRLVVIQLGRNPPEPDLVGCDAHVVFMDSPAREMHLYDGAHLLRAVLSPAAVDALDDDPDGLGITAATLRGHRVAIARVRVVVDMFSSPPSVVAHVGLVTPFCNKEQRPVGQLVPVERDPAVDKLMKGCIAAKLAAIPRPAFGISTVPSTAPGTIAVSPTWPAFAVSALPSTRIGAPPANLILNRGNGFNFARKFQSSTVPSPKSQALTQAPASVLSPTPVQTRAPVAVPGSIPLPSQGRLPVQSQLLGPLRTPASAPAYIPPHAPVRPPNPAPDLSPARAHSTENIYSPPDRPRLSVLEQYRNPLDATPAPVLGSVASAAFATVSTPAVSPTAAGSGEATVTPADENTMSAADALGSFPQMAVANDAMEVCDDESGDDPVLSIRDATQDSSLAEADAMDVDIAGVHSNEKVAIDDFMAKNSVGAADDGNYGAAQDPKHPGAASSAAASEKTPVSTPHVVSYVAKPAKDSAISFSSSVDKPAADFMSTPGRQASKGSGKSASPAGSVTVADVKKAISSCIHRRLSRSISRAADKTAPIIVVVSSQECGRGSKKGLQSMSSQQPAPTYSRPLDAKAVRATASRPATDTRGDIPGTVAARPGITAVTSKQSAQNMNVESAEKPMLVPSNKNASEMVSSDGSIIFKNFSPVPAGKDATEQSVGANAPDSVANVPISEPAGKPIHLSIADTKDDAADKANALSASKAAINPERDELDDGEETESCYDEERQSNGSHRMLETQQHLGIYDTGQLLNIVDDDVDEVVDKFSSQEDVVPVNPLADVIVQETPLSRDAPASQMATRKESVTRMRCDMVVTELGNRQGNADDSLGSAKCFCTVANDEDLSVRKHLSADLIAEASHSLETEGIQDVATISLIGFTRRSKDSRFDSIPDAQEEIELMKAEMQGLDDKPHISGTARALGQSDIDKAVRLENLAAAEPGAMRQEQ
jgi:hypothetical protein